MNNETIHEEVYKGYTIKIYPDDDISPWHDEDFKNPEPFSTYGRWGGYSLFETEGTRDDFLQHINAQYNVLQQHIEDYDNDPTRNIKNSEEAEMSVQKWIDKHLYILPIYVYEHGGIAMNTSGFSCRWDSGQAGYIYISKKEAREMKWNEKQAYQHMKKRVQYLSAICEGSIYGYVVEKNDEQVASCWGYVETEYHIEKTDVYEEAKGVVDYLFKEDIEKRKKIIKARAPIQFRVAL